MKEPLTTLSSPSNLSSHSHFTPLTFPKLHPKPPTPTTTISFKIILSSQSQKKKPQKTITLNVLTSILRAVPDWADGIKERRMRQKRSLYNHENWVQHRSSLRHVRHLLSSLSSRVILSLIPPVIAFTSFAVVIASYNSLVSLHLLPEFFPMLRASSLPYQLTAPALALLLVFRTEASYSRFEEGRKAWTKVISGTSDFARQLMATTTTTSISSSSSVVDNNDNGLVKKEVLKYVLAFPVALKCHLIYGSDVGQDLRNLLEEDDLAIVLSSKHRPRCIIEFISQSLQLLVLEDSKRNVLESKLSCLHEGIAVCEQLLGIPIPLSYTRLTSRFLVLWHLTLPIILWDDCNWIVVPATFISAASLFGIEEVGVLIEEPFPMLALDEVCNVFHDSIREAIAKENDIKGRLRTKQKYHANKISSNGRPNTGMERD